MNLTELSAIGPIDGRYRKTTSVFSSFFSESALIKYRVKVEIEYFIGLCELPLPQLNTIDSSIYDSLRKIYLDFSENDALLVKEIEKTTNHDVKAVEYFIKEKMEQLSIGEMKEFVHFGLTSQDINNTAIPMSLKDAIQQVYLPILNQLIDVLNDLANQWQGISMLARTHGQPASPTRLGKEIMVFVERLQEQKNQLDQIP